MLSITKCSSVQLHSPEALLSFTANTATTLLTCSTTINNPTLQNRIKTSLLPPLDDFIARLFRRAHLPPSVALVGLIYLDRLKNNLPKHARGDVDTPYRLFLSAILSASKFLSESGTCLTSHSISEMTDYIYTIQDVNSMERSFLGLIKYNLFVTMDQVKEYLARHGDLLQMYLVE